MTEWWGKPLTALQKAKWEHLFPPVSALQKAEDKHFAKIKKAEEKFTAAWVQLQGTAGKGEAERFLYATTGLKSARRPSKDDDINQDIRRHFEWARDFKWKFSVEQLADELLKSSVTIKGSRVALIKRINRIRDEMINAGELPADVKHTYTYDR